MGNNTRKHSMMESNEIDINMWFFPFICGVLGNFDYLCSKI